MEYKTIYADPPWPESGGGRIKRGADRHYPLMKVKDIKAMAGMVKDLAEDNCHLYLWATNNYLPAALEVMAAWGFTYKTMVTWPKHKFGLGQYFRGQTEHCLFGVRGNLPYKMIDGKRQQGTTLLEINDTNPARQHSEKPVGMLELIERVSYPPYIELFCRGIPRFGWSGWGDETIEDTKQP